jgi:hypothetical protein
VRYIHGQGEITLAEIRAQHDLLLGCQLFTTAQDEIGWGRFMEGMLTKKLSSLVASLDAQEDCTIEVSRWFKGLVKRLLEITHGLWIYHNLALHDDNFSILSTRHQERILKAIKNQLQQGQEGLREEDQ